MRWYIDQGPESDVVLTSRVRLARNLSAYPFPHRLDAKQAAEVADQIEGVFFADEQLKSDYLAVDMETLSEEDRLSLAEKRIISEDLAKKGPGHRAIISRDESITIMINEEDHIRVQSMQAGLNLNEAYQRAVETVRRLDEKLDLASCEKYGYLTACPTNTGTGMRASVMAHLPGLVLSGRIKSVIDSLRKLNFAVRGYYGEASKSQGHLFQISNQLTLGISENDLINDLESMLQQLISQERELRATLYEKRRVAIEDRVHRAFGLLMSARLITSEEAETLLSDVRLGIALGLLSGVSPTDVNKIETAVGTASIQKVTGQLMEPQARDIERANVIRSLLQRKRDGSDTIDK